MNIKKTKEASLENKKFTYLLMGFVFVLSLCYVALEWTEKEVTVYEVTEEFVFEDEELDIVQTQEQQELPPPPEPQAQEIEVLTVVEDDKEVAHIDINTEDTKEEIIIQAPVEAVVEEEEVVEEVFVVVEKMPEFPGGQAALFKFLSENVKYPVIAQENGIQGRVICQFVVNKDGSIVDVEVVRSGGDASLDKEAVRVIKSMPKWHPGEQRGKAVRVKYTVPVNFKLQ
ncbi:MAG: energy transducer TonB [Paludibacteraceae bacterium]|nr:energy transducer TonB [Paludibacteraceae bacterium]